MLLTKCVLALNSRWCWFRKKTKKKKHTECERWTMWDLVLLMFWLPVNRVFLFPFTVLRGKVWWAWGIVAHGWTLSCFHNGTKFSSASTSPYTNTHRSDIWAAAVLPPRQNQPSPLNLNVPGLSTSMGYLNYLLLFLSPNQTQEITKKSQWKHLIHVHVIGALYLH